VDLTDEDAVPVYMKISEKVLHLRRLGMSYTDIATRLGTNLWMAKRAARWGNIQKA
jgi:transcriptional regulator